MVSKVTTTSYNIGKIALDLFCLNGLWLVSSILGLGFLGVFPATYSLFAVIRKFIRSEHKDEPIVKPFFREYKHQFIEANAVGWGLTLIMYSLILIWGTLFNIHAELIVYVAQTVLALGIVYVLVSLIVVFPLRAHFHVSIKESVKWGLRLPLLHPIKILFMLGMIILLLGLLSMVLPFLVFFGMSSTVLFTMWYLLPIFDKYEKVT